MFGGHFQGEGNPCTSKPSPPDGSRPLPRAAFPLRPGRLRQRRLTCDKTPLPQVSRSLPQSRITADLAPAWGRTRKYLLPHSRRGRPAGGAVEQQQPVGCQGRMQRLEHQLPPATQAPAPPTVVNARPAAQRLQQVALGRTGAAHPEGRLDEAAKRHLIMFPRKREALLPLRRH